MTLKLVKLEPKYRRHLNDMMSQWYATGEKIIPYAIRRLDYRDFDNYLANLDVREETEELVRANYTRIFKELTGQDAELGEADAKNLIIKSFSLVLYQVMQYVEAKGRAELLKTSTGDALDALYKMVEKGRAG